MLSIIPTYRNTASLQSLCGRKLHLGSGVDLFTVNRWDIKNRLNPALSSKIAGNRSYSKQSTRPYQGKNNPMNGNKKAVSKQGVSLRFFFVLPWYGYRASLHGDAKLTR